jgi:small-conductance mechanosensitive channel
MDARDFPPETLRWALGLAVGFPLLMLLTGEAIVRLKHRGRPIVATLRVVRNLVLPALAALVLLRYVVGLPAGDTAVRVVQTLLWIFLIDAALSFVNDIVFASAAEGGRQIRIPRLLRDLARLFLVLIGACVVLSTVWGANLTSLAAALGVGSIVIGLALQEPLGNVFAGMMLLLERPVAVGDWIQIDSVVGRVVQITWRSVQIETGARELRVVPNSSLSKGSFTNLSRLGDLRDEAVELGFSHDDAPNAVKRVLLGVLQGIKGVLAEPAPAVRTVAFADTVRYRVTFTVARQEDLAEARDAFMTRVWYAARRHGLSLASPAGRADATDRAGLEARGVSRPVELLRAFPQFYAKDESVLEGLDSEVALKTYARGERVGAAGGQLLGLHLVLDGLAALTVRDDSGQVREIARVGRGEFFGEGTLLAGPSSEVETTALEDLDVLVLDPRAVQALFDRTPRLAREIGTVMDVRRKAAKSARRVRAIAS